MLQQCSASICRCNYPASMVTPLTLSRSASTSPIAVAGVSTPPPRGQRVGVQRQAQRALAQQHRRRGVARVALLGHARGVAPARARRRVDRDLVEAVGLGLLARALAGGREDPVEQLARRPEAHARDEPAEPGDDRARLHRREPVAARAHHLAVAEPLAVGVAVQRVAAAHDARVDPGHHERGEPAELLVALDGLQLPLGAEVGLVGAVGAERVGIAGELAQRGVAAHRVELSAQRVQRPSAHAAADALEHERRVPELARAVALGGAVQRQHAEVGGDRVEAARVHDPGAGLARGRVEAIDRLAHEQHLAGEVGVVRARLRARLHEREAVALVGADGGGDRARAAGHGGQRGRVGGVGDHQRPVRRARGQRRSQLLELGLAAAAQPDAGALRGVLGQVGGGQLAHEAGGSVEDDVQISFGAHAPHARRRRAPLRPAPRRARSRTPAIATPILTRNGPFG